MGLRIWDIKELSRGGYMLLCFADQSGSLVYGAGGGMLAERSVRPCFLFPFCSSNQERQICWQSVSKLEPLSNRCGGEGPLRAWAQDGAQGWARQEPAEVIQVAMGSREREVRVKGVPWHWVMAGGCGCVEPQVASHNAVATTPDSGPQARRSSPRQLQYGLWAGVCGALRPQGTAPAVFCSSSQQILWG